MRRKEKIVEYVDTSDFVVELNRVEERRPTLTQHDVSEVKVAVTFPDESGLRRRSRWAP